MLHKHDSSENYRSGTVRDSHPCSLLIAEKANQLGAKLQFLFQIAKRGRVKRVKLGLEP